MVRRSLTPVVPFLNIIAPYPFDWPQATSADWRIQETHMAQATSNGTNGHGVAQNVLTAALTAALRAQALADSKHAKDASSIKTWDATIAYAFPDGQATDKDIVAARFAECSVIYVDSFVIAEGVKAVTAKDVKAGKGTKDEQDAYRKCQKTARSAFGMGTNRAMDRHEPPLERAKQNKGGATATATTPPAGEPTTAMLPPSFTARMQDVQRMIAEFQTHHGARLSKSGKDAIGEIAKLHAECIADLMPKGAAGVTPPAPPTLADLAKQ